MQVGWRVQVLTVLLSYSNSALHCDLHFYPKFNFLSCITTLEVMLMEEKERREDVHPGLGGILKTDQVIWSHSQAV